MLSREPVEAINELFLRHAQPIRDFIACIALGDQSLADDVFQEVFVVVVRRAADYDPEKDFTAWVRGIARRTMLAEQRKRRRYTLSEGLVDLLAAEVPITDEWDRHLNVLRWCLDDLAPRSREIALLRFADDLLPTAIAARLNWTVNAINVALSSIRRQLRACCERRLEAES